MYLMEFLALILEKAYSMKHSVAKARFADLQGRRICRGRLVVLGHGSLRHCDQRLQGAHGNPQRTSRKTVYIGCVDANHFASRIENRTATAAVSRGRIVNQFVAHKVSEVSAGRGWPDQRQRSQFIGRALIVSPISEAIIDRRW